MPDLTTFGKRLEFARSQNMLRQEDLAERLGMKNTAQISQWESDKFIPRSARVQQLATELNTSVDWLLSGTGNPPARMGDESARIGMTWGQVANTHPVGDWFDGFRAELRRLNLPPDKRDQLVASVRRVASAFAETVQGRDWTPADAIALLDDVGRLVLSTIRASKEAGEPTLPRSAQLEAEDISAPRPSTIKKTGDKGA